MGRQVGTLVFLLERASAGLAICAVADNLHGIISIERTPSRAASRHERFISTPHKSDLDNLHRQVERLRLVVTTRETPSTRRAPTSPRPSLTANPYKNVAESRVGWINQAVRDEIEVHCRGVLAHTSRQDVHEASSKYVPVGQSSPQGTSCHGSTPQHPS